MEKIEEYIKKHKASEEKSKEFIEYLWELMKVHGYGEDDSRLYKKSNITRQSWSLIRSGKVTPSPKTILKIVFALELNNHECKYLLKKAGYTLASSSTYALVIRYCIENKIYDLDKVNEYLVQYGYEDSLIY